MRKGVADGDQKKEPYPPTHPWPYFHAGDNAPPVPVEEIPAEHDAGRWLAERLPKTPKKRLQAMHEMLERERASLAADKARYADIVERGAEALSRYDREIAHTSDAMAVATERALPVQPHQSRPWPNRLARRPLRPRRLKRCFRERLSLLLLDGSVASARIMSFGAEGDRDFSFYGVGRRRVPEGR